MPTINPYLNFPGNTEEAFTYYRNVFGGDFVNLMRFKDTPEAGRTSGSDGEKLMHISLPIGKGNTLMATDALEAHGFKVTFGNNINLAVEADSKAEAEKYFNALSKGGKVTMPLADQFWGAYFGSITDKYGIHWMISYTYPKK